MDQVEGINFNVFYFIYFKAKAYKTQRPIKIRATVHKNFLKHVIGSFLFVVLFVNVSVTVTTVSPFLVFLVVLVLVPLAVCLVLVISTV